LTISILLGFCSGRELPAHPCSLAWKRARKPAITPLRVNRKEPTRMFADIINSRFESFKIQGESECHNDWMRGGAGNGGG